MINLSMKGGGSYRPLLGKRPHPFLLKNSLSHSLISKRGDTLGATLGAAGSVSDGGGGNSGSGEGRVGKISRGGICGGGKMSGLVGNGSSQNFSINFIGSGFCDG
jgi:hypothetical protein